MNQVFKYIKEFYLKEFKAVYLLFVMAMLAILIYFNYWHGLEKKWVLGGKTTLSNFTGYYLLYFIPFVGAFLLQLLFYKGCSYYKKGWFWIILLLAPAFFSFRVNFDFHKHWVLENFTGADSLFYLHTINYILRVFVVLIPVFIIWFIKDRTSQPFYGTKALDNVRPYLIMLLIMVPLIALASTQKDFLHVYPKVKLLNGIPMSGWEALWRNLVFELSYGFDFVSIEVFFAGSLYCHCSKSAANIALYRWPVFIAPYILASRWAKPSAVFSVAFYWVSCLTIPVASGVDCWFI